MNETKQEYSPYRHNWQGQDWLLHPLKGMFWEAQNSLFISDLHLGKTRHFQRAGIPLPEGADAATLHRVSEMIRAFNPAEVWILGDLFHSRYDRRAWEAFRSWLTSYSAISWSLVLGNHDIIDADYYRTAGLCCYDENHLKENIELIHDPACASDTHPSISGHLHPGVELRGRGRQRLVLPCFYFSDSNCILPAMGQFTGLSRLQIQSTEEQLFVTANEKVIALSQTENSLDASKS